MVSIGGLLLNLLVFVVCALVLFFIIKYAVKAAIKEVDNERNDK